MSITKGFDPNMASVKDIRSLLAHARAVEAQNDELVAMLRKYEWWEGTCLECDQWEPKHLPGCDIKRLLEGTNQ